MAALKITDRFFSSSSESKVLMDNKDGQLQENVAILRMGKNPLSEASVSGYSTSSADSFISQNMEETSNESNDSKHKSIEFQMSLTFSDGSSSYEENAQFHAEFRGVDELQTSLTSA